MSLYIKNKNGEFIPVDISSVMSKDLNNRLVIIKVGSDNQDISMDDLELTANSFAKAEVLDDLDNVSVIITPFQVSIDLVDESEVGEKTICIQITSGEDIRTLEEATKSMYKKLQKKYSNVTILPTPLKVKEYMKIKDTLKRCKMRKKRRSRV